MRPRFAIYFAAGLTLALLIWQAVGEGMAAHLDRQLLTLLKPGEDGSALQHSMAAHTNELSFLVLLAVLQVMIIFYARRYSGETVTSRTVQANNAPA